MHFTDMGYFQQNDIPIMSHGEGCYVYDINGKKYLDGLAGLFASQLGHAVRKLRRHGKTKVSSSLTFLSGIMPINQLLSWPPGWLSLRQGI